MSKIMVTSLNVNGIGNPVKGRSIFANLRAQKADIHLIQETHSAPGTGFLWTREWGGQILFSHGSSGSRGVAILLERNCDVQILTTVRDIEGRFIGIDLAKGDRILTICSIYAPTQDKPKEQKDFLENVGLLLTHLRCTDIILGGDFNAILDITMDKNNPGNGHPQGDQGRRALRSLMEDWNLSDVWRVRHQRERNFTFRRGSYSSRLDLFLVSPHLTDYTKKADIVLMHASDHALIKLVLEFVPVTERGPGFWRFPTMLLSNPAFIEEMNNFLQDWTPPPEILSPTTVWEWLKHEIKEFVRNFVKIRRREEAQTLEKLKKEFSDLTRRRDLGEKELNFPIESILREL